MSDKVTRIVAIRHGETDWNVDTRIQGQLDIALNGKGQEQARRLGRALADEALDVVYSSDLQRALHTASEIAERAGAPMVVEPSLRERAFGTFEGLTWADIERDHPKASRSWRKRDADFGPPGGETLADFFARAVNAIAALAERHRGQHIAVVTHGGVLDALYRASARIELAAPRTWQLRNASINRVLHGEHGFSLVGWGDVMHLEDEAREEGSA